MSNEDSASYLRLSQFLALESQWDGARNVSELCHRICRTAALLLDTPSIAIGLARPGHPYTTVAGEGRWARSSADPEARVADSLLRNARATGMPQIRSRGDETVGIFPFRSLSSEGCLHVCLPRPLFQAREIEFLRFLASLCGIVIGARTRAEASSPAEAGAGTTAQRPAPDASARRYVAMAVHDLRNPLNVVAGYNALLQEGSLGTLTGEQQEAVEAIGRQCRVLMSAVDQLIELDRLGSGRRELSLSHFELRGLFEEIRSTCFAHCNGQIRWPGPEAAFQFQSDRRRLFSIVQNLIDNALKHAPGGNVIVDCTRADGSLLIDIRDRGPGLDAELRAKIVAQAQTGSEPAPRSGLGLYAVASHVHALGGTVSVESLEAGGTRIRISIPAGQHATRIVASPGSMGEPTAERTQS